VASEKNLNDLREAVDGAANLERRVGGVARLRFAQTPTGIRRLSNLLWSQAGLGLR
jgi:hypothetical protein